ncbi:MAG: DUF1622 domain-containing protein [Rhodanobacteraceae bacterium]
MTEEGASQARNLVEWSALGIELLAIALIVGAIAASTSIYLYGLATDRRYGAQHYESYKRRLGRALLLCLEILVAADIVRTVALDSTFAAILSLGLLVVVRTFLSWSLILEVEGRWPWQRRNPSGESVSAAPESTIASAESAR